MVITTECMKSPGMVLSRAAASPRQAGLLLDRPPVGGPPVNHASLNAQSAAVPHQGIAAFFAYALNSLRLGFSFLIALAGVPRTLLTCRLWRRCITKNNRRMRNVLAIPVGTTASDYCL